MVTKLTLEYDGTRFFGWSVQPGKRTVQGELEAALATLLRAPVSVTVAGRTDRGVHALGQVASYASPPASPPELRSLNAILPADLAVLDAVEAPEGFSARHDALSREYLYRVHTGRPGPSPFEAGRSLWWPRRADLGALRACAAALVGTHDFTAFTPTESYHRRFTRDVLGATWTRAGSATWRAGSWRAGSDPQGSDPSVLEFRIEADAFMRTMVRVLVGTMLEVGSGRRTLEDFTALLRGAPRSAAGPTAPPHGLYLLSVRYPDG